MMVELASVQDVYMEGGTAVVLADDRVVVLGPVPSHIVSMLEAEGSTTLESLANGLIERFGQPPDRDAMAACQDVLEELAAGGLVVLSDDLR